MIWVRVEPSICVAECNISHWRSHVFVTALATYVKFHFLTTVSLSGGLHKPVSYSFCMLLVL